MKALVYITLLCLLKHASANPLNWNETLGYSENEIPEIHDLQYARIGSKRCMDVLGCFVLTKDFFHPLYRPINFLPQDRATINTRFHLFSKKTPKEFYDLISTDANSIKNSPLNPKHPTKFIIHGFVDSQLYGKWMEMLKDNLLLHDDYNVIIVDWSKGNGAPYGQASANARVVGAELAYMIQQLEKILKIPQKDFHIIGHSLGSHIAGYAGERLKTLGRITAVDPAQPYFQNMPPSVRIDPTDADFVDAIHTDSASLKFLALGMSQAVGHVDFYPNNGMTQPGCATAGIHSIFLEGLVDAGRRFVSCNHQRAVDFFLYSINYKKALPIAYECAKYEDFLNGNCGDCGKDGKRCAVMGMAADHYRPKKDNSKSVKMYLKTGSKAPFWLFSYQVTVKLDKPRKFTDVKGSINLSIQGSINKYDVSLTSKLKDLTHGSSYTFLVTNEKELGDIKSVNFSWTSSKLIKLFSKQEIYLDYVQISPMNVLDQGQRTTQTTKFCNKNKSAVASKKQVSLTAC